MARGKDGLFLRRGIFAFNYKDANGEKHEKSCGTGNRKAAREFKWNFDAEAKEGILPTEMAKWRLDRAEKWWIEFRKPRTAGTTKNSEQYRTKHFIRILGNKRLEEITSTDLDDYQTARLTAGLSNASINKEVRLWSQILRKAKLWRRLKDDYKPLKVPKSDIGQALTRDQLRHLAEVAAEQKDWEGCFYGSVLAANTGLRGGELKCLRIKVIDLKNRQLRILRKTTKTDAGARYIELNADACEAATRLLARAAELGATEPEHYLFPKNLSRISHGELVGGRGYDPNQHQVYWDTAWRSLTEAVGLEVRFHDLRHTFITHMVEHEVKLGTIQEIVGHMSAKMLRHYTHITSGAARRAVEVLDSDPILTPLRPRIVAKKA